MANGRAKDKRIERRRQVWELRKAGYSQRKIVEALKQLHPPIYVGLGTVNRDIQVMRDELKAETLDAVDHWRTLITARHEDLITVLWKDALGGDRDAMEKVLRVLKQEADNWVPKQQSVALDEETVIRVIGGVNLDLV